MKTWITLILLIALIHSAHAQHRVRMVQPNGDTVTYVPEAPRTIVRHEHDTIVIRDTTVQVYASREVIHDNVQPMIVQPLFQPIVEPSSPIVIIEHAATAPKEVSSIGIFGYSDFRGSAIAPAAQILLGSFHLWLYAGAYYTSTNHLATWTAGVSGYAAIVNF